MELRLSTKPLLLQHREVQCILLLHCGWLHGLPQFICIGLTYGGQDGVRQMEEIKNLKIFPNICMLLILTSPRMV